jgi:hypothetical protein
MREDDLESSIQTINRWATEEIDRLVYDGTRPISICATVEAATREAAIARGNTIANSARIAEIESVASYVGECLKADLHDEQRPAAPSPAHEEALRRFT